MDFRRSRRVRLLAGLPAGAAEPRAHLLSQWSSTRMAFGRQRFRGPFRAAGPAPDSSPLPVPPAARKRPPSLISLLVGAVLTLWLLLFLAGHY